MKKVRFGIVGVGNMGSNYVKNLHQVEEIELTAVCDIDKSRLEYALSIRPELEVYEDAEEMFEKAPLDAVIICTPHYLHPPIAVKAFEHGLNVISEKPAGVYALQVREMIMAAEKSGKLFGVMFNQRTNPLYQKVREIVRSGELGELKRVIWIITNWYRSQSYYDSGSWRATWKGEGGGVLLNQCPHNLDLLQWMTGMPCGVRAFLKYGRNRDIEVENDVTAYLEYANGATGLFVTSTHETPGTNRLEVSGDQGKLIVEDGKLLFYRNQVSEKEFNATWTKGFGQPPYDVLDITPAETEGLKEHMAVFQNFARALLYGEELLSKGEEALNEVCLSNAMHLSDWTKETVDPSHLDDVLFQKLLRERIDASTVEKKSTGGALDVEGSFNS